MVHRSLLVDRTELFFVNYSVILFSYVQMLSTVVKHKKDGGQSGGVFDSYNIIRVRASQQLDDIIVLGKGLKTCQPILEKVSKKCIYIRRN